jgi:hypothetical protein
MLKIPDHKTVLKIIMKKEKITYESAKVLAFINKWKINQPLLAKNMSISLSSLKNKLYHPHQSYYFNDEEFIDFINVMIIMEKDIRRLVKENLHGGTVKMLPTKNIKNNSQKFRTTPFLNSQKL